MRLASACLLILMTLTACGVPIAARNTPRTCQEAQANLDLRRGSIQRDLDSRSIFDPLGMILSEITLPDEIAAANVMASLRDDLCFRRR